MSVRVVFFAKNEKPPNGPFLQKFLKFFRAAFLTLSATASVEKNRQEALVRRSSLK